MCAILKRMALRTAVGIDIGTYQVRVVVARESEKGGAPRVIGTGYAESKGLRHGYIVNIADVTRSIRVAALQAEETSGFKIKSAFLSIGGIGLDEVRTKGDAVTQRADAEITDLDVENALAMARESVKGRLTNRRVLHTIPLSYSIDGSEVLGRPQGMHGSKLSIETLFITCLDQHVDDLIEAVEGADIAVGDTMASPLAGSIVTVTNAEKRAGCLLANIGSETVSIVVFENSTPISLKVFRIGSMDITKDIALGLRISLEEAEQLKLGAVTGASYPKKKFDDILGARLTDMFELIDGHLKQLGKDQLLPAGIILSGGGSGVGSIRDIAEGSLKLPSKIAGLNNAQGGKIKDSSWAVAYGLTIWGLTGESAERSAMKGAISRLLGTIVDFFKQFLP
ncbi:cell division protein FtsA [Candidatus Kaiserbacteria bacterium CG10_big_fil_rev_8_21_14_0_10_45_20]|uniref:Cell division protein FtsA n=1 Tax=Candidatus Kaiserbacteria bacterium CG10_big_fil_rev_8_21_14_0_10_45_20 TaxID=1974607 RepID=A0A2H0UHL1_9BACT|nr:MAG: cell division protein FtsA [Candidatus Kaiserbacteria bacterium CG10_big_fil_rev_8_21_14_0_10_45_20]